MNELFPEIAIDFNDAMAANDTGSNVSRNETVPDNQTGLTLELK